MSIDEIKDILYRYYDIDEDGDKGCYVNGNWLSINEIINILEERL